MGQQSNVGVVKLDKNGEVTVKYNDFYEDLRLFNEKTTGKDSVYWTYIQSMSYMAGLEFHPLAQEQYLRFAIFSSLAMGCQGIMYWTYHQRANQRNELYLSAPIDRQDGKTPVWYYAKKVNAEIREYNSVFRGCKLEEYGHVGQIYAGCKELSLPIGRLAVIFADGEGVLVTRISNEKTNYEYIIIVSHSVRDYQKVTVSFKAGNTITEMTALGGKSDGAAPADVNNQSVVRTLAPGGYMIFSYLK